MGTGALLIEACEAWLEIARGAFPGIRWRCGFVVSGLRAAPEITRLAFPTFFPENFDPVGHLDRGTVVDLAPEELCGERFDVGLPDADPAFLRLWPVGAHRIGFLPDGEGGLCPALVDRDGWALYGIVGQRVVAVVAEVRL
jgi:hypothetical protein